MTKDTQQKSSLTKDRLLWSALIPQFILLLLSMLWINFSPKDNVVNYFNIDLWIIFEGLLAGTGLAIAGYGFYIFCKKTKKLYATVELFENILAPSFSILNSFDIIVLSLFASFSGDLCSLNSASLLLALLLDFCIYPAGNTGFIQHGPHCQDLF